MSIGPSASGLPTNMVDQLMQAEQVPIERIEQKKQNVIAQRNLLLELSKLTEDLRLTSQKSLNPLSFKAYNVNFDAEFLDVQIDKQKAIPGTYKFEVLSLAQPGTYLSSALNDKNQTKLGSGHLEYQDKDGEMKKLFIPDKDSSLEGIARLINLSRLTGLSASIINNGNEHDPYQLILTKTQDPENEKQTNVMPRFHFPSTSQYFVIEKGREEQMGRLSFGGIEVKSKTNTIDDLIGGAQIVLKKASPGTALSINITEDFTASKTIIEEFIGKINKVLGFIISQNQLNETSDTTRTLGGDITLQTLESRLREAALRPVETDHGTRHLSDLGISFGRDGLLSINQEKFDSVVSQDFNLTLEILLGRSLAKMQAINPANSGQSNGFLGNILEATNMALRSTDGILSSKKNAFQAKIDQMDNQINQKLRHLETKERGLREKFARLEEAIGKIKANAPSSLAGGPTQLVQ